MVFLTSVPPAVPCLRRPLPSTGSPGVSSPASQVLSGVPTPCRPSRRASFPSLGGTACCGRFVRSRAAVRDRTGRGLVSGFPTPVLLRRRRQGLPGSWGTLVCRPSLFDPGEPRTSGHCDVRGVAFRLLDDVGLTTSRFRGSITRPAHSLPTLHVAGHPTPRKTRFRLAATLCRAGLVTRRVPMQGFSFCFLHRHPPCPDLPGAPKTRPTPTRADFGSLQSTAGAGERT